MKCFIVKKVVTYVMLLQYVSEKVLDQEVLDMAHWIYEHEGLFIGKIRLCYIRLGYECDLVQSCSKM